MKTFNVGDKVRLTAKALKLSSNHRDWWAISPEEVDRAKKLGLFTVTETDGWIELDEFLMPWSWNPKLFTKRGIH